MKIIHIITRLDKGGSAENVLETCRYFSLGKSPLSRSYDIIIIYGGKTKIDFEFPIVSYYVSELQRNIFLFKDLVAFLKLVKIIKKEKPNIVHTHSSKAGILGRTAAFFLKLIYPNFKDLKIIHTPHGHIFYGYYNKLFTKVFVILEKFVSLITDKLIALTEGEKEESLKYGVGKKDKWVVIHSGVNLDFGKIKNLRSELGVDNETLIVGTVARLEPVKGVVYFVESIPIILNSIKEKKVFFLIVGDGTQKKIIETKIKKFNLQHKVKLVGMREDVVDLINTMDIYVQPSLNEGMGKTIVLASALGKPVVATKVQGIPSVVINCKTGLLVSPKDPQGLAEGILKLINEPHLRVELGTNGKNFVTAKVNGYAKFSIERMIYLLEKLYKIYE